MQSALGQQVVLVGALEAARAEAAAAAERIACLEYQVELMAVERQEASAAGHSTRSVTPDTSLEAATGGARLPLP